jgi:large subunit ribosomal protein L13
MTIKPTSKKVIRKIHLFDAESDSLGRIATQAALILRGKNKVDFDPACDNGDCVVVVNTDSMKVTGNKKEKKHYFRFSGYPGGISSPTLGEMLEKDSRKVMQKAVYGMLPKNKLRGKMMNRLLIYKDEAHKHQIDVTH